MNAVGIDVSKGKSMVAILRPYGEVVLPPFEIEHTDRHIAQLAALIKSLDGETRVVMEYTGSYHAPVSHRLYNAGIFVCVVNAKLVHDYANNSLRRAKTDKKDAIKLANYALDHWATLPAWYPEEEARALLKSCYRQYGEYAKVQTMLKNNLISVLDLTFPNLNRLFTSARRVGGTEKWVDFAYTFWHSRCVSSMTEEEFAAVYRDWCDGKGYRFSYDKAVAVHQAASTNTGVVQPSGTMELLVRHAAQQLRNAHLTMGRLAEQMTMLASLLPEYGVVMGMFGVGETLGPQLMAEIGDVRRFRSKRALVAFAGIDVPPYQSGTVDLHSRSISKRGSASLRRTLFLVMSGILQNAPENEPVYAYMAQKRSEGKPYRVYMMAAANKFLRIYYARVTEHLRRLEEEFE
ncbi:MAG: IS110 family transposase [Oscillospiraceae bacterium]|nr:IS110 family transposase [Oscillospiraceae bacterium]